MNITNKEAIEKLKNTLHVAQQCHAFLDMNSNPNMQNPMAEKYASECEALSLAISALQKLESGLMVEKKTCEYNLYKPTEHGYDAEGYFYDCTCGANYIDIENVEEDDWQYCPYCGCGISARETYQCVECECAEFDGDSYYCENRSSKYCGENVDDACFAGCHYYKSREQAEAKGEKG
jgi:hypothetical protein